jgi:hypothetical protein
MCILGDSMLQINFCDQLDAPSFLVCNIYITSSPQHVSSTTALIMRRSQLYYASSGMTLPTGCHAVAWQPVGSVIPDDA